MTSLNDEPVNLQGMLDDFRCGKRELLTYDELVQVDIQIGSLQAQNAALRAAIRAILHERALATYVARLP